MVHCKLTDKKTKRWNFYHYYSQPQPHWPRGPCRMVTLLRVTVPDMSSKVTCNFSEQCQKQISKDSRRWPTWTGSCPKWRPQHLPQNPTSKRVIYQWCYRGSWKARIIQPLLIMAATVNWMTWLNGSPLSAIQSQIQVQKTKLIGFVRSIRHVTSVLPLKWAIGTCFHLL